MEARHVPVAPSTPLVMVVDDDRGLVRLISRLLERAGYACIGESDPASALRRLERATPSLLLIDHQLGVMTGDEFLAALDAAKGSLPFIVITGQGDERVAVQAMKQGALDYVVKDAGFLELIPLVVRRALDHLSARQRAQEAEAALRRSEANLVKAQQISKLGSYEVSLDGADQDHWSVESYRIFGMDPSQPPLSRELFIQRLVHPDDRERVRQVTNKTVETGVPFEMEFRLTRPDGAVRYLQSMGEPVRDGEGRLIRLIGTVLDVTERKELQQEILQISELERRRIGHDLHDGICQHLAGIELMCQALEQELTKRSKPAARQASNIAQHVRQAIHHARGVARGLSPVAVEENGLMVALQDLAENIRQMFKVDCVFRCDHHVLIRDNSTAVHLFRIAQEAVSNAIKHGRAGRIEIHLASLPDRVVLGVSDDGAGLEATPPAHRGMGLRVMQYRADVIKGSLVIQKNANGGTTVACSVRLIDGVSDPVLAK